MSFSACCDQWWITSISIWANTWLTWRFSAALGIDAWINAVVPSSSCTVWPSRNLALTMLVSEIVRGIQIMLDINVRFFLVQRAILFIQYKDMNLLGGFSYNIILACCVFRSYLFSHAVFSGATYSPMLCFKELPILTCCVFRSYLFSHAVF